MGLGCQLIFSPKVVAGPSPEAHAYLRRRTADITGGGAPACANAYAEGGGMAAELGQ